MRSADWQKVRKSFKFSSVTVSGINLQINVRLQLRTSLENGAMASYHWVPRRRHYDREKQELYPAAVLNHPLQRIIEKKTTVVDKQQQNHINQAVPQHEKVAFVDPLGK